MEINFTFGCFTFNNKMKNKSKILITNGVITSHNCTVVYSTTNIPVAKSNKAMSKGCLDTTNNIKNSQNTKY